MQVTIKWAAVVGLGSLVQYVQGLLDVAPRDAMQVSVVGGGIGARVLTGSRK